MILINHELKTPLTSMLSFLELLSETTLTAEQKKYYSRILQSSQRLHRIIDDVLQFVSAETGVLKVAKKKLSVHDLITRLVDKFAAAAAAKKQKIVVPRNDVEVKADPNIISAAFERLIDNAIKFGDEDSEIEIELSSIDADHAELAVSNSGKPLSEATIHRILQPFTLDEDILKHSQGLGLGLSLTQALLKRHSSQLHIECPRGRVRASFQLDRA